MAHPLEPSSSSDYFEPDDPDFLDALQTTVLPGDVDPHLVSGPPGPESSISHQPSLKRLRTEIESYDDSDDTYGSSRFGELGEYLHRKRAKLQIQNEQLGTPVGSQNKTGGNASQIFSGLAIYINGWTEPSVQDLRQLIILHGGIYHAYLDRKSMVTHIITCALTPAKIREFKFMKVVRPEWLVDSAKAGVLLPWQNYIYSTVTRDPVEGSSKTAQQSLFNGFLTQTQSKPRMSTNNAETNHIEDSEMDDAQALELRPNTLQLLRLSNDVSEKLPSHPISPKASTIAHPLYTTDPKSDTEAEGVPHYASHISNLHAERAMANPEWRSAHTAVAPDFIEGYYNNSRLHHLSTWKAELKNLVQEARERADNLQDSDSFTETTAMTEVHGVDGLTMKGADLVLRSPSKGKSKAKETDANEEKVIMHCDFDCFFVSAGLIGRSQLRGKPVVVCHSQGAQGGTSSTSEIASASYEARSFGIKNGMSLQQARKLCPTVLTIPYEFERYKTFSLQFYTILMSHADDLQAVSVDEALVDVTSTVTKLKSTSSAEDPAKEFAEAIRAQVLKATGCEVSIGISHNILLARLATRHAKPAGSFHLLPAAVPAFLAPLSIVDLHGFGRSHQQKAQDKLGTTNLGELLTKSKAVLCDAIGKTLGETLYNAIRGIDHRKLESHKPRKSVSCEINYGIRFETNEEAEVFIYGLADRVSRTLNEVEMLGRSITLKVMKRDPEAPIEAPKFMGHGSCNVFNKQMPLAVPGGRATSDSKIIGEHSWRLLKSFNFDPKDLRGIGIQIQKLEPASSLSKDPGQAKLPFQSAEITKQAVPRPEIDIQSAQKSDVTASSKVPDSLLLPSFSQVDKGVFDALPGDVRKELEAEYKRRSASPFPMDPPALIPRTTVPSAKAGPSKISVKGTSRFKGMARQFGARNRPSIPSKKNFIFAPRAGTSTLHISDAELRNLEIDPEVFSELPVELQREQLLAQRIKRNGGMPMVITKRKAIKPMNRIISRSPSAPYRRRPPPKARHPQPPFLKQQGKNKGEKLCFTEADDIQRVIEAWVEGFREFPPNKKDVDYFATFLVKSVDSSQSTDVGVEKAVTVVKWWLVLLRRYWGDFEHNHDVESEGGQLEEQTTSELVGNAWWKAFREVKERMDMVARKKFGGRLSLK